MTAVLRNKNVNETLQNFEIVKKQGTNCHN